MPRQRSGQQSGQPEPRGGKQTETQTPKTGVVNDIDTEALQEKVDAISADPDKGRAEFHATTSWSGRLQSETHVDSWNLGGERLPQNYTIRMDEPTELLGEGEYANPQMYLQAAINACMLNTYVAAASVMGVELEELEFESSGELDLRGFLGIDESVDAGYPNLDVKIRVKGDGTPEQYEKMWELVQRQSPNYFNTTEPVEIVAEIEVLD